MALKQRLDLRQSQSLVMTPQLQQAIKLLQMSNLELAEYVEHEIEQNPLLEREEGRDDGVADDDARDGDGKGGDDIGEDGFGDGAEPADTASFEEFSGEAAADSTPFDAEVDNTYTNDSAGEAELPPMPGGSDGSFRNLGAGGGRDFDDPDLSLENTLRSEPTLRDHLVEQLHVETEAPAERMIGLFLIDSLDEAGYLRLDLAEAAGALGCGQAEIEQMLIRMQRFDPAGMFARNLQECLALQLRDRNRYDPAIAALLDNLELVADGDYAAIARVCGVDHEDVVDMLADLRSLNPKPAFAFEAPPPVSIIPDILMRQQPGGGWLIELNQDSLPRVLVNAEYYSLVNRQLRDRKDRLFVSEQYQAANWLVKSLHQRATTILRVATEIVRQQDGFFVRGVGHLRPMVLRDIATALEMHESTVSRVTSNKYIATPRGIYELKYFFSQAIGSSAGGPAHSAEAVRFRIRELIEAEKPTGVLSDDRLVELLRAESVDIARRTVAKYREAMRIPSSVERRRIKARTALNREAAHA
ncbi:MAG: RNA polymerase factor sigma-54 [Acetobacterales bacterium]